MGRLRGFLWLTAGLVVAVLAGLVAFTTLSRASAARSGQPAAQPTVSVVVATQAIAVRAVLTEADVELKEVPVDSVPEGAVSTVEDAIGKVTLVEVYPGEVLLTQRLIDPNETSGDGRVAVLLSEDEVLIAFPADDLMSQSKILKPGDRVDLLFSLDFPVNRALVAAGAAGEAAGGLANQEEQATFNLLQNVAIAAIVTDVTATGGDENTPRALLLTITPQDALMLKYVKDAGGIVDIVLRAPGMDKPYEVEPVDVDYMINKYQIPTGIGQ